MNEEERKVLQQTYELAAENNKILRGIRSANRWATALRFLYWIIIIGISVGAFYYIQPYINSVLKVYSTVQSDLSNIKNVTSKIPGIGSGSTQ